ncbi:sodium:solute symporter family protein, partial [bacterium]|nr:sodium:solute symporter family protein [bacterium]
MTAVIIICIYLSLLLGLGIFSHKFLQSSSKDFFVASHSIGPVLLLMSVFGTTMTAFAMVGSTAESYASGIGVYGKMASWSG